MLLDLTYIIFGLDIKANRVLVRCVNGTGSFSQDLLNTLDKSVGPGLAPSLWPQKESLVL